MADWSAEQYLKFADERTRPARDLLAQVPLDHPRLVYDLGCGPGNSTELLIERFPQARVVGIDSSPDMLARARRSLPKAEFVEGDLKDWQPGEKTDLLFANAVFQWVPDHVHVLQRLMTALRKDGVLAVQMPDNLNEPSHVAMRETALAGSWAEKLKASGGCATASRHHMPIIRSSSRMRRRSISGIRSITTPLMVRRASSNG
jgi:trans-aconitate 2-methyltransferase